VPLGWGTERVEAEARAAFPGVDVARYDGSVPRSTAAEAREAFRSGRARVLVGTRMAAPLAAEARVGVAALVLADATLGLPDFRAGERTFQLAWHLAEGVASGGTFWVQSYYPEHPALEAVARGARGVLYEWEWAERQELGYPPARRMAGVTVGGRSASRLAEEIAERCRAAGLPVLGPTPRRGGELRLLLLGDDELPGVLASALAPLRGRRRIDGGRVAVDVDPVEA
jgi:primosomal protein N' (replication factor Y)